MEDEESDLSIDDNHGAARFRIPSKGLPFATKILLAWRKLNQDTTFGPKIDSEYDMAHHQYVLYISEPGFHTTKLLNPPMEKRQR